MACDHEADLKALAIMVRAIARQHGYAENTSKHTSLEVRGAWETVCALSEAEEEVPGGPPVVL